MEVSEKLTEIYSEWLKCYPYEWFITTRLPPTVPLHEAHKQLVADVLRPLALHFKCNLASMSAIDAGDENTRPHIHSLVLSKGRKLQGHELEAVCLLYAQKSGLVSHNNSVDVIPYRVEDHPQYVAKHLLARADLQYNNKRLLIAGRYKGA